MHDLPLITTIAAAFTTAWLLGLLTQRLGLSPIVGYLLAGVLIGPHSPGFVGDVDLAHQLAEVGVILLMFGVGLHFHLKDLLAVKSVAIPGAIGQSLVATLLGIAVFAALGLPVKSGAVIGMAMAVASTVVLMRVLMDADALNTPQGHVAVGWLLVEDVFTVIILVLIPVLGTDASAAEGATRPGLWASLGLALLKLSALVAIVMLGGSRAIPWVLVQVARLRCASCSRSRCWSSRSRSRPPRTPSSAHRWPSGRSWRAWWSRNPRSVIRPRPMRCRCAMPSPCCSSCRWGCSSTRHSSSESH